MSTAQPADHFVQNLRALALHSIPWTGACFHPRKQEQQRNPSSRVILELRPDAVQNPGQVEGQRHRSRLEFGRVKAVFRG